MKIEHTAFLVQDPHAVAQWYEKHLGMKIVRKSMAPSHTHFLCDSVGDVMIEIYRNDNLSVPNYSSFDPLVFHMAFMTDDIIDTRARLIAAGATPEGEVAKTPAGDELAMLRDPWGVAIQFVHRAAPMVGR